MAFKHFLLENGQAITIYKRRRSRSLRLSIAPDGEVRVSIPLWAPYKAGIDFARSRQGWIEEQRPDVVHLLAGQQIGKAHRLQFRVRTGSMKPTSRIKDNAVIITHALNVSSDDPAVQVVAEAASERALRLQATALLPRRLAELAKQHELDFSEVKIKQLKSRWGSCDQHKKIALNLFLMQLPWELIDYVLLHELAHTRELNHSPEFWAQLKSICPDYLALRKELHKHKPVVNRLSPL